MNVKIIAEAKQDLIDGYRFYERLSSGLGEYFLNSLFTDIDSLAIYAGVHAKQFGFNRMVARRFPFSVYCRIEDETVTVFAVLDCRSDPEGHHKRLL